MRQVIVIGAGLGGLAAAIHLQLTGFQAVVFEQNATIGGRANRLSLGGYHFDTGPSLLNYPWVFTELFAAAGRRLADYLELLPIDPGITFSWPDGQRLVLSSSFDRLREELARFDPEVGPQLANWLRRAGKNYRLCFEKLVQSNADSPLHWLGALRMRELWDLGLQRTFYRQLQSFFRSRYICEALGSYGMYLGGSPYNLPGLFEILPYGELAYGLWLPRGGIYGLVEAIGELARELGVDIRTNSRVLRIIESNSRAAGVELTDGEKVSAAVIVSNCDVPQTDTCLLPPSRASERGIHRARRLRMTPGMITYYWALNCKLTTTGHHSVFLPLDYKSAFDGLFKSRSVPDNPPFYLAVTSATDTALAPSGKDTAFVLVPAPTLSQAPTEDWTAAAQRVKRYILKRLQQEGIMLKQAAIAAEQILTPLDWQARFGLYDGSALGAAHHLFQLGPWRPRNYNQDLPGLYYVGASTTPGTGLPMVALSGKMTAARIQNDVR